MATVFVAYGEDGRSEIAAVLDDVAPDVNAEVVVEEGRGVSDETNVSSQKKLIDAIESDDREWAYVVMGNVQHGAVESFVLPSLTESVLDLRDVPVALDPVRSAFSGFMPSQAIGSDMSRILVTGGLGGSGRWIVDRLADDGHEVMCVDQRYAESERGNVDVRVADLTDRGDVFDLVGAFDPDGVVHWAAIPDPLDHPGGEVFENNIVSTYNVLEAAGRADARVVWASSESALGFPFAAETPAPDYLPIDEEHPLRPEDPYGVSKEAGEALARQTVRRHDVSVVSIRPSWIQYPGEYDCLDVEPPAEGVGNFWSYVDVRDIASIVAAALDADIEGHEAVFAVADENYADRDTVDLFEEQFGAVPEPCDLSGDDASISNARAADLLGWEPARSWREAADEDVDGPTV